MGSSELEAKSLLRECDEEDGGAMEFGPTIAQGARCPGRRALFVILLGVAAFAGVVGAAMRSRYEVTENLAATLAELQSMRSVEAKEAEAERRKFADEGDRELITMSHIKSCQEHTGDSLLNGTFCQQTSGLFDSLNDGSWNRWTDLGRILNDLWHEPNMLFREGIAYLMQKSFQYLFPLTNFVQGFPQPGFFNRVSDSFWATLGYSNPKWKPPVKGETMGVVTYQNYAKEHFGKSFPYPFFDEYYTGNRIPSWEDNENHQRAISILDSGVSFARRFGQEPMDSFRGLEPRFAFDNEALISVSWAGFEPLKPNEIKYASNGVWGVALIEKLVQRYGSVGGEVLGPLMTDSVFSVHLRHDGNRFYVDMSALEKYTTLPGFAPLGGKAAFEQRDGSLHMVFLQYNGTNYTDFTDPDTASDYKMKSKRSGWRMAEAALITSLLSMTNLVLHVKDLHLELAAAFQAVTVDAFADNPTHPLRRLLDPFVSRSVQATNDNFKLLFEYNAAEFSLAPLPVDEQLRLMDDFIREQPLNLAELDMESFGDLRNMSASFSTKEAVSDPSKWGWRWHYRSRVVQRLYDELIDCRLGQMYKEVEALNNDEAVQAWYQSMVQHLPALSRATKSNPDWAPAKKPDFLSLKRVLRVLLVWLSWIHEDVGHSAASYVYNPVYTPMCVPEDGVGVPMASWVFNVAAYRGFVFLERAALLDEELPNFWFGEEVCTGWWLWRKCTVPETDNDKQCFKTFQSALTKLGEDDKAFHECEKEGFYSCVGRVETAVSS
mmetsp:Transcript_82970/g.253568  ORF Transcript_82970/g.253568 Transcript_82970/m.253568 type:complete len:775 (-) Transcript_82970:61-2385(-)